MYALPTRFRSMSWRYRPHRLASNQRSTEGSAAAPEATSRRISVKSPSSNETWKRPGCRKPGIETMRPSNATSGTQPVSPLSLDTADARTDVRKRCQ